MFMPTPVAPPITTITNDDHRALRKYLENCVENERFEFEEPLMFVLVLSGDKPAATMQPSREQFPDYPWTPQTGLKQLCDQLDVVAHHRRELGWWFVAPVDGRLDLLPSSNRTERSDAWIRRLGVVLGYPPNAIEMFLNRNGEWTEPHELVADGQFSSEKMADAGFVVYRHDDSVEGYEWAIQAGKHIRLRLEELADKWDLPELNEFVDGHWEFLRDEAIPETTVQ